MVSVRSQPGRRRALIALLLCLLAISLEPAVYQLALLPVIRTGGRVSPVTWCVLFGALPAAAFATGLLVPGLRTSFAIVSVAAFVRRVLAAIMADAGAAGLKKLDPYHWDYWTWMLAVELLAWLLFAFAGHRLRMALRWEGSAA